MKTFTVWYADKVTNLGDLMRLVKREFPRHSIDEIGITLGIVNVTFEAKEKPRAKKRKLFKSQM